VSTVQCANVPYITWSLPQQIIADAAVEQATGDESISEGEGQGDAEGGGGAVEDWDDLMLDDDE
jgi:hypothetical protein